MNLAKEKKSKFYIQDTRSYVGNSVVWWRQGGHGYTTNLDEAWKVDESWRGRDTDKLWPCKVVDGVSSRECDMQKLKGKR